MMPSELYLPTYSYSPEEIFKGKILLFNVNFFREPITIKKKTKKVYHSKGVDSDATDIEKAVAQGITAVKDLPARIRGKIGWNNIAFASRL